MTGVHILRNLPTISDVTNRVTEEENETRPRGGCRSPHTGLRMESFDFGGDGRGPRRIVRHRRLHGSPAAPAERADLLLKHGTLRAWSARQFAPGWCAARYVRRNGTRPSSSPSYRQADEHDSPNPAFCRAPARSARSPGSEETPRWTQTVA